jgi:SPP1 gp7 family putative phage head morphogenesis protein
MKTIDYNALLIRAALKHSFDAQDIAKKWSHHIMTKTASPEDKASAATWVSVNVNVNMTAFESALKKVYGAGWAFGTADADHKLATGKKDVTIQDTNWDTWQPGNQGSAALLEPTNGLRDLMATKDITIKGLKDTTISDIGRQLADTMQAGLSIRDAAAGVLEVLPQRSYEQLVEDRLKGILDNPARAMLIARTETARAMVAASLERYTADNIQSLEWLVGDPCDDCAKNEGVIVPLGDQFPSGDTEPPVHPNCLCDIAPVTGFDATQPGANEDLQDFNQE